jgi:hypothetical protein
VHGNYGWGVLNLDENGYSKGGTIFNYGSLPYLAGDAADFAAMQDYCGYPFPDGSFPVEIDPWDPHNWF